VKNFRRRVAATTVHSAFGSGSNHAVFLRYDLQRPATNSSSYRRGCVVPVTSRSHRGALLQLRRCSLVLRLVECVMPTSIRRG